MRSNWKGGPGYQPGEHKRLAAANLRRAGKHEEGTAGFHSAMQMHHIHLESHYRKEGNSSEADKQEALGDKHARAWRKAKGL